MDNGYLVEVPVVLDSVNRARTVANAALGDLSSNGTGAGNNGSRKNTRFNNLLHNRRMRPFLFAGVVTIILLISFIINFLTVLGSLFSIDSSNLSYTLTRLELSDLCGNSSRVIIEGSVFIPTLAGIKLTSANIVLKANGEEMLKIPIKEHILFDPRNSLTFSIDTNIEFTDTTVKRAIELSRDKRFDTIKFTLYSMYEIQTAALWIPINFQYPLEMDLARTEDVDNSKRGGIALKEIIFGENGSANADQLKIDLKVGTFGNAFSKAVSVNLPDMEFGLYRQFSAGDNSSGLDVMGLISLKEQHFSMNPEVQMPLTATVQFSQKHVQTIQAFVVKLFQSKENEEQALIFKPTEKSMECRLARWIDEYGIKQDKKKDGNRMAKLSREIRQLVEAEFDSVSKESGDWGFVSSFKAQINKHSLSEMLGQPGQLINVTGSIPKATFDLDLFQGSHTVGKVIEKSVASFSLAHDVHYEKDASLIPFVFRAKMKPVALEIVSDPIKYGWDTLHLRASREPNTQYISQILAISFPLACPEVASRFRMLPIPDSGNNNSGHEQPPSNISFLDYGLDLSVNSDVEMIDVKSLIKMPLTFPSSLAWLITFRWPSIEFDLQRSNNKGEHETPLLRFEIQGGDLSLGIAEDAPLSLVSGSSISFNARLGRKESGFAKEESSQQIANFISDFLRGSPVPDLSATFTSSGKATVFKGTWPGFTTTSSIPANQTATSGVKSPFEQAFAFNGLSLIGISESSTFAALSLISRLGISMDGFSGRKRFLWITTKSNFALRFNVHIHIPILQLLIGQIAEGDDQAMTAPTFFLESGSFDLDVVSNLGKNADILNSLKLKSFVPTFWPSQLKKNPISIDNPLLLRLGIASKESMAALIKTVLEVKKMAGRKAVSDRDPGFNVKLGVRTDGSEFFRINMLSKLISYILVNEPIVYYFGSESDEKFISRLNSLPVLVNEAVNVSMSVKSDAGKISLHGELTLPSQVYSPQEELTLVHEVKDSVEDNKFLADSFVIEWGALELDANFGADNLPLGHLKIKAGRLPLNLGKNTLYSADIASILDTLSNSLAFDLDIFQSDYFENLVQVLLLSGSVEERASVLSVLDSISLHSNYVPCDGCDRFSYKLVNLNFMLREDILNLALDHQSASEQPVVSLNELVKLNFDVPRRQDDGAPISAQEIPCLLPVACDGDASTMSMPLSLNLKVSVSRVKDILADAFGSVAGSLFSILKLNVRPELVRINVSVPGLSVAVALDKVQVLEVSNQPINEAFASRFVVVGSESVKSMVVVEEGASRSISTNLNISLSTHNRREMRDLFKALGNGDFFATNPYLKTSPTFGLFPRFLSFKSPVVTQGNYISKLIGKTITGNKGGIDLWSNNNNRKSNESESKGPLKFGITKSNEEGISIAFEKDISASSLPQISFPPVHIKLLIDDYHMISLNLSKKTSNVLSGSLSILCQGGFKQCDPMHEVISAFAFRSKTLRARFEVYEESSRNALLLSLGLLLPTKKGEDAFLKGVAYRFPLELVKTLFNVFPIPLYMTRFDYVVSRRAYDLSGPGTKLVPLSLKSDRVPMAKTSRASKPCTGFETHSTDYENCVSSDIAVMDHPLLEFKPQEIKSLAFQLTPFWSLKNALKVLNTCLNVHGNIMLAFKGPGHLDSPFFIDIRLRMDELVLSGLNECKVERNFKCMPMLEDAAASAEKFPVEKVDNEPSVLQPEVSHSALVVKTVPITRAFRFSTLLKLTEISHLRDMYVEFYFGSKDVKVKISNPQLLTPGETLNVTFWYMPSLTVNVEEPEKRTEKNVYIRISSADYFMEQFDHFDIDGDINEYQVNDFEFSWNDNNGAVSHVNGSASLSQAQVDWNTARLVALKPTHDSETRYLISILDTCTNRNYYSLQADFFIQPQINQDVTPTFNQSASAIPLQTVWNAEYKVEELVIPPAIRNDQPFNRFAVFMQDRETGTVQLLDYIFVAPSSP